MRLYEAMLEHMTDEQRLQTCGKLVQVCTHGSLPISKRPGSPHECASFHRL
jgi:hypothetical protein